jgi:Kdo2-lipid IVA lauroyltransferase/acyltransferase
MNVFLNLLKGLSYFLNLFPQKLILLLGDFFGWTWFVLIRFRRHVVIENMTEAFQGSLSSAQIKNLALRNFQHYCRTCLEILQSIGWTKEDFKKRVAYHGLEHAERFYNKGEGGYFLTSHLGNWELMVGSGAAHGIPVDIVVKRAGEPKWQSIIEWYRDRLGAGILWESGTAKDILRSIARGRFLGFIFDQFMGPPIGLPVKFFGRLAGTTVSLALLTEKRNPPVLPAYCYRDENGRLHTVIEPPLEYPKFSDDKEERLFEKTQFFNDVIERQVRRHPEQWLWLHRRWKSYRGKPRWESKTVLATVFIFSLFASSGVAALTNYSVPTGIALPPDPKVSVPIFSKPPPEFELPVRAPVAIDETLLSQRRSKKEKRMKADKKKSDKALVFTTLAPDQIPFEVGERLEYDLGWTALSAGRAILEVRKGEPFQGRPTFHLWANALSSRLVDAIYHVDNTVESFTDAEGLIPYKFLLHMNESAQKKETRVAFDHPEHKAYYWAKRISERWGDSLDDRSDPLTPRARDMFSGIYFARTMDYTLGKKQEFYIYENGKNWQVETTPVANELVTTKVGAFQCWKIKIRIGLDNYFKPTGDVFMWLSDDSKRYIVKFDAKIKIGSLYGKLVSIRERL